MSPVSDWVQRFVEAGVPMNREKLKAELTYYGAWVLGIALGVAGLFAAVYLLSPDIDVDFREPYCADGPRRATTDEDVEAFMSDPTEYHRTDGFQCYPD